MREVRLKLWQWGIIGILLGVFGILGFLIATKDFLERYGAEKYGAAMILLLVTIYVGLRNYHRSKEDG